MYLQYRVELETACPVLQQAKAVCASKLYSQFYSQFVTICTTSLTLTNSKLWSHNVFMCFVWISEQRAIISLYSIN